MRKLDTKPFQPLDLFIRLKSLGEDQWRLARHSAWSHWPRCIICRQPFSQLLTVNAFVKEDDYTKQVLFVLVLISGKKKRDYRCVFHKLLELLLSPAVKQVTLDFECTVWKVLHKLLPDIKLLGCVFHWTQALWSKVSFKILICFQRNKDLMIFSTYK